MTFLELKLLTPEKVDENLSAFQKMQGYPLVSHGKKHVWLGLIPLDAAAQPSQWLGRLAGLGTQATPAHQLYTTYRQRLEGKAQAASYSKVSSTAPLASEATPIVRAVGLSSRAYSLLKIDSIPGGDAFREGFGKRFSKMVSQPEENRFGVVLVLASNDDKLLNGEAVQIDSLFDGLGKISWEKGSITKVADGAVRDHFGFREGLSQPLFFDTPERRTQSWTSGWDPSAALSYVLTREPNAEADEYGSHMAFLKIEQDKAAFDSVVQSMAEATGSTEVEVKAWMMGRKADGEPLVQRGDNANDFDFEKDSSFQACPAAAHIRKVNPRTEAGRNHRILRRSVFYDYGPKDCGALFQCFQSKLETGFEFVFRDWALGEDHPKKGSGLDAMLGSRDRPPMPAGTSLLPGAAASFSIRSFTTVKHGEYFYFPSIRFFDRLPRPASAS